jgi:hypothetical protein
MVRTKKQKATRANRQTAGDAKREGAVQMGELADKGLSDESKKLVMQLAERAVNGDKNSLQKLEEFANKTPQGDDAEAKASGLSQATVWEAEPEWMSESSEEEAETSIASREPENHLN